jgi:hypothetical protein
MKINQFALIYFPEIYDANGDEVQVSVDYGGAQGFVKAD